MRALLLLAALAVARATGPVLSRERLVFQTDHGDIHMAFYYEEAPVSAHHIRRLGELGAYNTNHFFRVDKGFVAQTADVASGRTALMSKQQRDLADVTVPLEVRDDVKHDKRGVLSMARHSDPHSGGSSFSILLGPAPHLDGEYAVFGEVTAGWETLDRLEELPTRQEGIFVMPLDRITIQSTYMYVIDDEDNADAAPQLLSEELAELQQRYDAVAVELERHRKLQLPGT